jgi:hypothetical protein
MEFSDEELDRFLALIEVAPRQGRHIHRKKGKELYPARDLLRLSLTFAQDQMQRSGAAEGGGARHLAKAAHILRKNGLTKEGDTVAAIAATLPKKVRLPNGEERFTWTNEMVAGNYLPDLYAELTDKPPMQYEERGEAVNFVHELIKALVGKYEKSSVVSAMKTYRMTARTKEWVARYKMTTRTKKRRAPKAD